MSQCGACGASLVPETSFCGACGASVGGAKKPKIDLGFVCPECHQFNDAGAEVCRSCSSSLVPAGFTGFLRAASIPGTAHPEEEPEATEPALEAAAPAPDSAGQSPMLEAPSPAPADAPRQAELPPAESPASPDSPRATQAMPALRPAAAPGPGTQAFGPLQPGRAKLVLIRGRGYQGAEFRLNQEEVTVGRAQGFVLFPEDPHLADRQATLVYKDGQLCLRDDGGPGGSWLRIREAVALRANAEIAVGDTRLKVQELAPVQVAGKVRLFGAPRAEDAFRIEERLAGDRPGRAWICSGDVVTIGHTGSTVSIEGDPLVAGRHAEIRRVGPRWLIADSGTTEGTFVRVAPGVHIPLRHRDRLRIGSQVLEIQVAV